MLISISKHPFVHGEDVEMNVSFTVDVLGSTSRRQLREPYGCMRGVLRDGTEVSVGLSLSECAELYIHLHDDPVLRAWADTMKARAVVNDLPARMAKDH